MHSHETRDRLERCRTEIAGADLSDEMRLLAYNLVHHLLEMNAARRLRPSVFLLALESLEFVPELQDCVAELRDSVTWNRAD